MLSSLLCSGQKMCGKQSGKWIRRSSNENLFTGSLSFLCHPMPFDFIFRLRGLPFFIHM